MIVSVMFQKVHHLKQFFCTILYTSGNGRIPVVNRNPAVFYYTS